MSDSEELPMPIPLNFRPRGGESELDQLLSEWAERLTDEDRRAIYEIFVLREDGVSSNEDTND